METSIIVILIIIAAAFFIYKKRSTRTAGHGKNGNLRQQAQRMLRLPPAEAEETIDRHIEKLKVRHPNRTEEWYLEKIIYDLERDH